MSNAQYRAHTQVLEALRKIQLDHYAEMQEGFARLEAKMDQGFATMNVGMMLIAARLASKSGSPMSPGLPDPQPERDRKPLADQAARARAWELLDRWKAELDQFD